MRRRAIFANQPIAAEAESSGVQSDVMTRKPMPGHWKQRVVLARSLGSNVKDDAQAREVLKRWGYGDVCRD